MRGVLLLLLTFVYSIVAAENEHAIPPEAHTPDPDEYDNEETDADFSSTQPSLINSENEENATLPQEEIIEMLQPEARNLDGNDDIDKDFREETSSVPSFTTVPVPDDGTETESCGPPPSFERTTIVSGKNSTYGLGSVIIYSCQFGYVTDGPRQVKCIQSGDSGKLKWTEARIHCLPRSCGTPGEVDHGRRIGSLFTFPNKVSFECDDGYELKGHAARYCQPSGTWSGELPKCQKVSCKPPPNIDNGKVSYTSLEFGSQLQYTCDPGFVLKNHHRRYCAGNKTWSGEEPICKDAQCDHPVAPKGGSFQLIGDKPAVNSRVIFTCDGNKILSGSRVSICMENGDWTFPIPTCLDPCSIPEVPHGKIYTWGRWNKKEESVGSVVDSKKELYLSCDRNYEPLGQNKLEVVIKCKNGIWEEEPRCEPASCNGDPPETKNGVVSKTNRRNGGYVWYNCLRHFRKIQTGNITCTSGTWIGITPVCSDTRCYFSKLPRNGLKKEGKEVFFNANTFTPTCVNGYKPSTPNGRLTCQNGDWKGPLPPCIPARCEGQPPRIDHGRFKPFSEDHSSIVQYECDEGFVLNNSSKVHCLFGEWSGNPPTCQDSRCYHKDLQKFRGLEINADDFTPNKEFMTVKCTEGFTVKQNSEPFCSNGVWQQPKSPCEETGTQNKRKQDKLSTVQPKVTSRPNVALPTSVETPPPDEVCACTYSNYDANLTAFSGYEILQYGMSVKQNCSVKFYCKQFGYHVFRGNGELVCDKCKDWHSSEYPQCFNPTLGDVAFWIPQIINVSGKDEISLIEGQMLQIYCYSLQNYGIQWDSDRDPNVKGIRFYRSYIGRQIPALVLEISANMHNSGVYSCSAVRNKPRTIRIKIIANECPRIEETEFLTVSYENGQKENSRVFFYCKEEGARLVGKELLTCQSNGQWSGETPHCKQPIQCPELDKTDGLTIDYIKGRFVGNTVAFHCFAPRKRIGEGHAVCRQDGFWSNPVPLCLLPNCSLDALFKNFPEHVTIDNGDSNSDVMPYNSTVNLGCKENLALLGGKVATCKEDGNWIIPTNLECTSDCVLPQTPDAFLIIDPSKSSYGIGDAILLKCPPGRILSSDVVRLMCLAEGWSDSNLPTCIPGPPTGTDGPEHNTSPL